MPRPSWRVSAPIQKDSRRPSQLTKKSPCPVQAVISPMAPLISCLRNQNHFQGRDSEMDSYQSMNDSKTTRCSTLNSNQDLPHMQPQFIKSLWWEVQQLASSLRSISKTIYLQCSCLTRINRWGDRLTLQVLAIIRLRRTQPPTSLTL